MPLPARAPDQKLNPELERLVYQLKVIRQEAEGLVVGLNDAQLNWQPSSTQWSVAQCFAHLNLTNRKMAEGIEAGIRRGRQAGQLSGGPFTYGFLSRMFLRMLEPPVSKKFKAPPAFVPPSNLSWSTLQQEWSATHDRVAALMMESEGLDLARIKVQSPASSFISYPLGIAFWIQTAHDRRHLWQIRQLVNNPAFPARQPQPAAHS